ncbi:MAG: hypothetical protein R3330_01600, partial [Saprospiraceae bacterium]|nr:hypothetical protein [Saprospiraceae bacterium]
NDGMEWEHVSISIHRRRGGMTSPRTPTWEEMCRIKDIFWDPEDRVVQYHPPRSEYVNCHPYTLHLWRPVNVRLIAPPWYMVGPREDAG